MGWFSTLSGGTLGLLLGGPIGAIIGASLGSTLAQAGDAEVEEEAEETERTQTVFFTTVFAAMGYLAKSDGRVSAEEIRFATRLMDGMELGSEERDFVQNLFRLGKASDFPIDDAIRQFRSECPDPDMLNMFVWILMSVAYADGAIDASERSVVESIAAQIGMSRLELESIEATARAERGNSVSETSIKDAYEVLGLKPDASNAEVKRRFRDLMNSYHPDKLLSKGLPEEMIEFATKRTGDFSAAYEHIRQERNL